MLLICNMSALPKGIIPLSITDWVDTAKLELEFKVFVFSPATDLLTVAKIFTLWPA